jgi:hypothetical protein
VIKGLLGYCPIVVEEGGVILLLFFGEFPVVDDKDEVEEECE